MQDQIAPDPRRGVVTLAVVLQLRLVEEVGWAEQTTSHLALEEDATSSDLSQHCLS